jgi:hypothetical protein
MKIRVLCKEEVCKAAEQLLIIQEGLRSISSRMGWIKTTGKSNSPQNEKKNNSTKRDINPHLMRERSLMGRSC